MVGILLLLLAVICMIKKYFNVYSLVGLNWDKVVVLWTALYIAGYFVIYSLNSTIILMMSQNEKDMQAGKSPFLDTSSSQPTNWNLCFLCQEDK